MSVMTGKISSSIQHQQVKIDKLGRWMTQRVSNKNKTIIVMTLHREPQGTNKGT